MKKKEQLSKFLSLVLRHKPEAAGITLDEHGWANVKELIKGINNSGRSITKNILEDIVETDEKQRYSFNREHTLIRANQGHSITVNVDLKEAEPPEVLYHGTGLKSVDKIMEDGLLPMSRLYVHLSKDIETAINVGSRHGEPFVLYVNAGDMYRDGHKFYLSENGVWLTKKVDKKYLYFVYRKYSN